MSEEDAAVEEALRVARSAREEWRDGRAVLRARALSGGISNLSYVVCDAMGAGSLVVKLYGKGSELLVDRAWELQVLEELGRRRLAPRVLFARADARAEEFLHDARALDEPADMAEESVCCAIASKLAQLHAIPFGAFASRKAALRDATQPQPVLWRTVRKWLDVAEAFDATVRDDFDLNLIRRRFDVLAACLQDEVDAARSATCASLAAALGALHGIVLCHNDLLSGNVMRFEHSPDVVLIDFEYSDWNPAGFDIANHFCEHCGFELTPDYARLYPSRAVQQRFMESYLLSRGGALSDAAARVVRDDALWPMLERALFLYACASDLWWGSWAVLQSRCSAIDFDYRAYAKIRLHASWSFHAARAGLEKRLLATSFSQPLP